MRASVRRRACAMAALLLAGVAHGQALCSSDRAPAPRQMLERFLSADCAECWTAPGTPTAGPGVLALDWVLPGAQGEDAPLSAVARRDSLWRAQALGLNATPLQQRRSTRAPQTRQILRVAHGLALNGYLGVSLRLSAPDALGVSALRVHVALIEVLPAGTEGSPVVRHLVRNTLDQAWDARAPRSAARGLSETRVMALPEGTQATRLALVGWAEDPTGRVRAIAVADCRAPADASAPGTRRP